ncbi:MAG: Rieske (2Fe-2S) protein [Marinilabiliales bacterium]|nr:MAG: Rieske (2Fe-2S) protein [Marinilabiliales bacterium]
MERREFLLRTMKAGAAVIIPVTVVSCSKDDNNDPDPPGGNGNGNDIVIDLADQDYSLLNTAGNAIIINNIIIANTGDDHFVALSSVCTHAGCQITYNHSNGNFPCPCHGSVFSADGAVVTGPATTAVRSYSITRDGSVLTVEL